MDKLTDGERLVESEKMIKLYNGLRAPIILIDFEGKWSKYNIPKNIEFIQFQLMIRNKLNLKPEEAIFYFCNNNIIPPNTLIEQLYNFNKNPKDGWVYIKIFKEETFGYF